MIPSPGRIVEYILGRHDADQINVRRDDALKNKAIGETGFVLHVGNPAEAGSAYPMMITRVWGNKEDSLVNGQVFLDGNDTLWVTSVSQGDGERKFREFQRV